MNFRSYFGDEKHFKCSIKPLITVLLMLPELNLLIN
jgi:hypothetical protein